MDSLNRWDKARIKLDVKGRVVAYRAETWLRRILEASPADLPNLLEHARKDYAEELAALERALEEERQAREALVP
jgi:hypothetical protein